MSAPVTTVNAVGQDEEWLYRAGGVSALAIGLGYIVIIPLYVTAGALPAGSEAKLVYLAGHIAAWWAIIGLSVLTDLLYVPVALALYLALKRINRSAMLLAVASLTLFVALELAITWPNYAALIGLSIPYAAAATDAQRARVIVDAEYVSALLSTPLVAIYTILVPGMGVFITGSVMLNGAFSKAAAWLGVVTGILALVASIGPLLVSALSPAIIVVSTLTLIWFLLVGYRLIRLGQP